MRSLTIPDMLEAKSRKNCSFSVFICTRIVRNTSKPLFHIAPIRNLFYNQMNVRSSILIA